MNDSTPIMTRKRSALAQMTDENVKSPEVPVKKRKKATREGKENQSIKQAIKASPVAKPKATTQEKPPATQEVKEDVEVSEPRGIQSIPDHIVEQIFLNLDRDSMLQLAMTDKNFNRVFSDHKIMSTFKLKLNFDTENLPTPGTLKRRYQKVILKSFTVPTTYKRFFAMKNIFRSLGPHIKCLKLWDCTISDMWITRILQYCPQLESLKFRKCTITRSDDDEVPLKKFSLEKLKTLSICETRFDIIVQLLEDVTTLKEVKVFAVPITEYFGFPVEGQETEELEHFKAIIARQKSLKKLCLTEENFFNVPFNDCEFQLDHLELSLFVMRHQMHYIDEFLRTQTKIESCVFNVAEIVDTNALVPAMMYLLTLRTLKKLRLVLFTVKAMQAIYEQDFCNNSITELDFLPHKTDHAYKRVVEAVAKKFRNVRKLRFGLDDSWLEQDSTSDRTFEPLNSMQHLEDLTLESFNSRLVCKIALPQLKSLTLVSLNHSNQNHWNKFFPNNPSIQHLAILDTCQQSKHSVIRLIESAVMNLTKVETICACACSIDPNSFHILCGFAQAHGSSSLKILRVCDSKFSFEEDLFQ